MFGIGLKAKMARITEVMTRSQRGIHKRIDENRELMELLNERAPDLMAEHPWIEGWLKSQDDFLTDLLATNPVPKAVQSDSFPRPWPGKV